MLCLIFSCQRQGVKGITEEQARAIVDIYLQARNEANLDLLDKIYHPDVLVHDCSAPQDIVGLEALKNYYSNTHTAFSDFDASFGQMIVKADKIVWVWTFKATNTGSFHTPLGDLPPTGKRVEFSGVAIDRIVNEKIVEEWVYFNVLDLLQQVGFTITPPKAKE
jgi:steroid delta-isomerase-like uncharacterized protein